MLGAPLMTCGTGKWTPRSVRHFFPPKGAAFAILLSRTNVERTKTRPLAAGDVTQFGALTFLGAQLTAGLAVLTQLNWYR